MSIVAKEAIVSHLESPEEFPVNLSEVWAWLGYSKKEDALRGFRRLEMAESIDFIQLRQAAENSIKPRTEIKMTVDCFKLWAMSAQTAKGKEVRLYYIQVEKEWKSKRSAVPQISIEQVEAFQFQKDVFSPWIKSHPVAGEIFLGWQGVGQPVQRIESSTAAFPSIDSQGALDGAFLNLNRSGLMMNKLFKFLDRIPTMKALDEDFVNDLVAGLSESERLRSELEDELSGVLKRSRKLKEEHERTQRELRSKTLELEALIDRCRGCASVITVDSPVHAGKVPLSLKPAN